MNITSILATHFSYTYTTFELGLALRGLLVRLGGAWTTSPNFTLSTVCSKEETARMNEADRMASQAE